MFNEGSLRAGMTQQAAALFGYTPNQISYALFVGKFARGHEERVCSHLREEGFGVYGVDEIVEGLLTHLDRAAYVNDPVIMTLKCLQATGRLQTRSLPRVENI